MGETDVTFRRLLRKSPRPFLQLAFPHRRVEPFGPPLDASVDRSRQRTVDNLFRIRDGDAEAAVHVEIERDWRPDLPRRLFEYASAAVVGTELPVWSVIVLMRPGGQPPSGRGEYQVPGADEYAFSFRYRVVPLWQLDARQMQAELGIEGAPFCVAMSGADEAFIQSLVTQALTQPGLSGPERRTTVGLLYIVTAAILGSETARRIFHMDWLMQDPNVQELMQEWEDKGRAKGHAAGHVAGHAEGRAEEARALLYKVLAARSVPVTPDVRARIDAELDVARLEAWLDAALTAATIGDVFRDG